MVLATSRRQKLPPVSIDYALKLGLSVDEWERMLEGLGRAPNEVECAIFSQIWSEDYSYKSSNSLLQAMFRESNKTKRIPGLRAGVVDIGEGEALVVRMDHNNLQSRFDPFFGAQASLGTVVDELAQIGAVPVAAVSILRFGSTDSTKNHRALQRSVEGLAGYTNPFGVPFVGADIFFHPRYDSGAMINTCTIGILRSSDIFETTKPEVKSPILYIGAPTGRDGLKKIPKFGEVEIEKLEEDKLLEQEHAQVKVSDPYISEQLIKACRALIRSGLLSDIVGVTAGGLATALFQLARRVDEGIRIDLDAIPLRGEDLRPTEILISESCERVVAVVDKKNHRDVVDMFLHHGIQAYTIGEIIDSDDVELSWHHHPLANAPFRFAMAGTAADKSFELSKFPPMLRKKSYLDAETALKAKRAGRKVNDEWSIVRDAPMLKRDAESEGIFSVPEHLEDVWVDLLADPNACSRDVIYGQFDQYHGTNTVIGAGRDAAVIRIKRAVDADSSKSERGVALGISSRSLYVSEDPYLGTVQSMAEALRNISAVGATPICVAHCLNFGDPAKHKEIADFAEATRGLGDVCRAWSIPVVSDAVSLFNGSEAIPVMPTPGIVMVGVLEDVTKTVTPEFKEVDDVILLLGTTKDELGCSEYLYYYHKRVAGSVPEIDFDIELRAAHTVSRLVRESLVVSAHDIAIGGIAQALTECCVWRSKPIGAVLELDRTIPEDNFRADAQIFSETSARYIVSCTAEKEQLVRAVCAELGVPVTGKGTVGGKSIRFEGAVECSVPLNTAARIWSAGLNHIMGISGSSEEA